MSDHLVHLLIILGIGTGVLPGRPAQPRESVETVACRSGGDAATGAGAGARACSPAFCANANKGKVVSASSQSTTERCRCC